MLTGELRSQVDRVWDSFWVGGIANPLEVLEQITYPQLTITSRSPYLKTYRHLM